MRSDTLKKFAVLIMISLMIFTLVGCKDKAEDTSLIEVSNETTLEETMMEETMMEDM